MIIIKTIKHFNRIYTILLKLCYSVKTKKIKRVTTKLPKITKKKN